MDVFESCRVVSALIAAGKEADARNELIRLLAEIEAQPDSEYTPLLKSGCTRTSIRRVRDGKNGTSMRCSRQTWEMSSQ